MGKKQEPIKTCLQTTNSKMEQASDQRSKRCERADLFVHFALQTCLISNGTEGEIVKNM